MHIPHLPRQCAEIIGSLGPLELNVLEALCARGEATSREILGDLATKYAYTTISTTLERLVAKGIVRRRKNQRTCIYAAIQTPWDILHRRALQVLQLWLATSEPHLVISQLLNAIAERDAALLDELERRVQKKRRDLGQHAQIAPDSLLERGAT